MIARSAEQTPGDFEMVKWLFGVCIAGATAVSASAAEICTDIDNDLDRLACYDKEAGRTPTRDIVPTDQSAWEVSKETSKLTDDTNVYLVSTSKEEVKCFLTSRPVLLVVRCVENKTSLMFATSCHMASSEYNDSGHVTYRIDNDKAKKIKALESTDNKALGLWSGGSSIPVIKEMFGKKTMIARMRPFSESPFTVTFDISGIDRAILPLRKACGW